MIKFQDEYIPPRLTPSLEPFTRELSPQTSPPTRKSIYYTPAEASTSSQGGWRITIQPYTSVWIEQYQMIHCNLNRIFSNSTTPARYTTIEHIGSTSVPGLCAKPNIDVLVTFADPIELSHGVDALLWEVPDTNPPFVRYTRIPNGGGILGRESFKLYLPTDSPYYVSTPEQSVYLIDESEGNPEGRVQICSYRSLRDTLHDVANEDLLNEYADVKWKLAEETFEDSITYSVRKDKIVRKILKRAGWTDEEVDEKERLSERVFLDDEEPPY